MERLLLIGMGGHAKSVIDSIESTSQYEIIGFLDVPEKTEVEYRGYKMLGGDADAEYFYKKGIQNACLSIGYMGKNDLRKKLYEELKEIGFSFPAIIDASAIIAKDAMIGEGTFIGKNAVVNSGAEIGVAAIINTGVIIEHDVKISAFSHIAVGSIVCGGSIIGERTVIGAGATVINQKVIGNDVVVAAGAVVVTDVPSGETVYGIPAKGKVRKK